MATKADDKKELDTSTADPNMPIPTMHRDTVSSRVAIGDELTSFDELRSEYKNNPTKYKLDGIVRVEAGPEAKDAAAGKLLSSEKLPTSKFIIVVNSMTDNDLASSGSDSWPFSFIKKNECVAALYDHSHFENLNVVFTTDDDDQPGLRTVMLYAHWIDHGRGIGIYAGKTQANSKKIRPKIHDHRSKRNKAARGFQC